MEKETISGVKFIVLPLRGRDNFKLIKVLSLLNSNGEEGQNAILEKMSNLSEDDQKSFENTLADLILSQNKTLERVQLFIDDTLDLDFVTMMGLLQDYQGSEKKITKPTLS